ncbi:MAG: glycoside hydrolase family 43 protein [Clostridiales bacterium]|nr:glycoside hydrolase family 43 protein [Clostridiales bacterium]
MHQLTNPLLPGFYPDPSICRVGDDFYMVTSSFSYFPGVPVFHSRDLCHWEQIGHCLNRPEQLPLDWQHISGGIYAPTIRWHDGLFYMVTTNVSSGGNFYVTAEDPAGPWSNPVHIRGAAGIDPTIFWDEDGTAYMTATTDWAEHKPDVWIAQIDLQENCIVGERRIAWQGAMVNAWSPEAPHIYRKDGWYYLMIAEGGTEDYHAVTIARSRDILGPYEGYPGNPILTHRHLGLDYSICNVGHGDLVQLQDGSWYMVALASRLYGGYHKNMGRETFIAPVDWSGEWPVVSPGTGRVEWTYPAPALPEHPFPPQDQDDFRALCWNTLGTPGPETFTAEKSRLTLRSGMDWLVPDGLPRLLAPNGCPGFYARRQQHMRFSAGVTLTVPAAGEAGLMLLQHGFNHLRIGLRRTEDGVRAEVVRSEKCGKPDYLNPRDYPRHVDVLWAGSCDEPQVRISLCAEGQRHFFTVNGQRVAEADGSFLGSETAGGFVGAYVGCYVSGSGAEAVFADFRYQGE